MEVAPQHPEGERVGAGEGVEEGLLLGGRRIIKNNIAGGGVQGPVPVEADLADAAAAGLDQTAVAAGEAPHGPCRSLSPTPEALDQLALSDAGVEHLRERGGTAVRGEGVMGEEGDDAAVRHEAAVVSFSILRRLRRGYSG